LCSFDQGEEGKKPPGGGQSVKRKKVQSTEKFTKTKGNRERKDYGKIIVSSRVQRLTQEGLLQVEGKKKRLRNKI